MDGLLSRLDSSSGFLAIIFRNLVHQFINVYFVDLHKFFILSAEIVYITGIDVEPKSVYMQVICL